MATCVYLLYLSVCLNAENKVLLLILCLKKSRSLSPTSAFSARGTKEKREKGVVNLKGALVTQIGY